MEILRENGMDRCVSVRVVAHTSGELEECCTFSLCMCQKRALELRAEYDLNSEMGRNCLHSEY